MSKKARAFVVVAACGLMLVAGAVGPAVPAAAASTQDDQMRQAILLLRGYVDRAGSRNYWLFPAEGVVRAGWYNAPIWPTDPWTGAALSPGHTRGHYGYWVSGDRRSYRLTGYLSSGTFAVTGGMSPKTRLAYNHRSREGAVLVQQFIELWASRHEGVYPAAKEVDRLGEVGEQPGMSFWPSNPWTHEPLAKGTKRSCFEYVRKPGGSGYVMTMHFDGGGKAMLTEKDYADLRQQRRGLLDETMRRDLHILAGYIDEWALLHGGALPGGADVAPTGPTALGAAHDYWPADPYSGEPLTAGDGLGHFAYAVNGDGSYTLTAPMSRVGDGNYSITGTPPPLPSPLAATAAAAADHGDVTLGVLDAALTALSSRALTP